MDSAEYSNNSCQGEDCENMDLFLRYVNATADICVPEGGLEMVYNNAKIIVFKGKVDVSFNIMFMHPTYDARILLPC